jgi:hypothetical protein
MRRRRPVRSIIFAGRPDMNAGDTRRKRDEEQHKISADCGVARPDGGPGLSAGV